MAGGGKKTPGDPFQTSAALWNSMVDAAEWVKSQRKNGIRAGQRQDFTKQSGIVKIKNIGPNRSQFDVVGLPETIFDPGDAIELPEFRREVTFEGRRPLCEHVCKFAILIEPINEDAVGLGVVSGVVQCLIEVEEEAHEFADITPLDSSKLTSLESGGSAQILWKEPGLGEKWAVVRLSNSAPFEVCVSSSTTTFTSETSETTTGTTGTTGTTATATTGTDGTGTTATGTTVTGTATLTSFTTFTTGTGTDGTGTTGTGTTGTGTTATGTTATATTGTGTTGTGTTATTTGTTQEFCPCGSSLWTWDGVNWNLLDTSDDDLCDAGDAVEPDFPGTVFEQLEWVCCPCVTTQTTTGTTDGTTGTTGTTATATTATTGTTVDCPDFLCSGSCQVSFEVVTDVRCEDGEIVLDKATICLDSDQVILPTTTTAGA